MLNPSGRVAGRCVATALAFAMCPSLFAQAPTVQGVEVAKGDGVFRAPGNAAAAQNTPIPFPLDESTVLDLMPTPEGGPPPGFVSANGDLMQIHDASTGKTWQIPGMTLGSVRAMDEFPGGLGADGQAGEPLVTNPYGDRTWNAPMTRVLDTSTAPFRSTCKIFMLVVSQDGTQSGWFRCSGSLIDAKTVLTAGHCVYTRRTAFVPNGPQVDVYSYVREIYVIPGWAGVGDVPTGNPVVQNFGYAHSTTYTTTTGWVNDGNFDFDVGVITLDRPVGMITGWYGMAWGGSCGDIQQRTYSYSGFPGESCGTPGLHNGRDMYTFNGQLDSCPGNQLQFATTRGCFTTGWGGMSGGPLYYQNGTSRLVHAVDSNGDRNTQMNFAKLTANEADQIINTIIPSGRGANFDLSPLQARFTPNTFVPAGTVVSGSFLVTNATNGSRNGTFTYQVVLSSNDTYDVFDTVLSTQQFTANFGPMSSLYVNVPATAIPANTPPGTYYIGINVLSGDSNPFNDATNTWDMQRIQVAPNLVFNDSCIGAPAAVLGTYTGTTADATTDGSASCGGGGGKDVWFSFTAPASGTLALNTCGSDFDTVLSVHSACPGTAANAIACNDDSFATGPCGAAGAAQSALTVNVTRGVTYSIRIAGYLNASGNYVLNLSMLPPANDHCSAAIPIAPNTVVSGSTDLADTDGAAPCGYSANAPDVWYTFTPTGDHIARLYTCGSNYDTVLSVHTGCPGTLDNTIACNDDVQSNYCGQGPGLGYLFSFVAPEVVTGQTYYIRVAGYNGNHGDYQLHYDVLAPLNDYCGNPLPLHAGANPFGNLYASTDGPEEHFLGFCCGDYQVNNDMWYYWRSPCDGTTTIDTFGTNFDTKLAIYTQQCQIVPNQAIAGNDDANGTVQSRVTLHTTAGTIYQVRVGGYQQNRGNGFLNVAFQRDCIADVDDGSNSGLPDCGVTIDDLLYYLNIFEQGVIEADVDDGSSTGTPDGGVTIDDLLYFLFRFENGC